MKKFLQTKRTGMFLLAITFGCLNLSARQYCQEPISPPSFNGQTINYTCRVLGNSTYEITFESATPFQIINANNFYANPGGMHIGGSVTPVNTYTNTATITITSTAVPTVYASNMYFNFQGGNNISYDFPKDITWVDCTPVTNDTTKPVMTSAAVAVGSVTAHAVKLYLTASDNVGVSNYIVNDEPNGIVNKTIAANSSSTLIIDDLASSTTYHLRVKAQDAAGNISDNEISVDAFTTLEDTTTECSGTTREILPNNGELEYAYHFYTNPNNTVTITFEVLNVTRITGLSNSVAVRINNSEAGLLAITNNVASGTFGPYENDAAIDIAFSIAYAAGGLIITQPQRYTVGENCDEEPVDPGDAALCEGTSNEVIEGNAPFEYRYAFSTNPNNTVNLSFEILYLQGITGLGNTATIKINDTEIIPAPFVNSIATATVGAFDTNSIIKIAFSIAYANGGISETKAAFYTVGNSSDADACMPPGTDPNYEHVLTAGCSDTSSHVLHGNAPFTYAYKFSTNQDNTVNVLYQVLDKKNIKYFSYRGAVRINGTEVGITHLGTNNLMGATFGPYKKGSTIHISLAASYYAGGITTTQPVAYTVGNDCDTNFGILPDNPENELCHGTNTAVLENNEAFEYFYKFSTNKDSTVNITYEVIDMKNIAGPGVGAYIRIDNAEDPVEIPFANNVAYLLSGPYRQGQEIEISFILPYRGNNSETQSITYVVGNNCTGNP